MATTWQLDPAHSEVQFKVRHLMITTVTGYFKKFNLEVETDGDDFTKTSKIQFTADIDSIDTNNEQRDRHLKSPEFFDAETYTQLSFTGKDYSSTGEEGKLEGELNIRGIAKPASFDVEFGGIVVDPYGRTKAGFTITGKISRKEFGLTWSGVTEAGQIVVGDEIKVQAEIQLVKQ